MNYIGSKHRLSSFIKSIILDVVGDDLSNKVFCDIFAGTGIVGRIFKSKVKQVISNDLEYYSYILNKNYIENNTFLKGKDIYLRQLNNLPLVNGFIYNNYCSGGNIGRKYFSENNGKKIDAVRIQISKWKDTKEINDSMYYYLLASLLESADEVANTASVYGAYLKKLKKTAQTDLIIKSAEYSLCKNNHLVFNEDSNSLIKNIQGDILYLDPPYNSRQYGANYHLLNTIALYDDFVPSGKTGLRKYNKSLYCSSLNVKKVFEDLIKNAKFKYIFLSYNNEGLMNNQDIKNIMCKYGRYHFVSKKYQRFKADNNRIHINNITKEFLHVLIK